jgi:hypothetical protein
MGSHQGSGASAPRKPSILSRDLDGNEHPLAVADHPAGLVSLFDEEMHRTLHPAAAIDLAICLIQSTRGHFRGVVGPISGSF